MNILVVHQYYLRAGQAGGSRFNELVRLWRRSGHSVNVLAGGLDYSTNEPVQGLAWRLSRRFDEDGVPVWRCRVPRTYNAGFLGRGLALVGFSLAAGWAALRLPRPDVVVASSPPLTVVIPAWVVTKVRHRGVPWIFEIRDLWPESAITTGVIAKDGLAARLLFRLESWACRNAAGVCGLTPAFVDDVISRGLVGSAKAFVVPNAADLDAFHPTPVDASLRNELGWGNHIVALYAGAHGRANALGQLVEAATLLKGHPRLLIATVGEGPERRKWEAEARARSLTNIVFHGPVPKSRMPAIVNAADIGLAVLQRNPTFRTVYPNKVFDYMACAKPTLLGIDGVARQLVCDQAGAGVFAEPEDAASIAAGLVSLCDDALRVRMGESGRAWVLRNASREKRADEYLARLAAVA